MRHVTAVTSTRRGPHVDTKPACSHYHTTKNLDQQAVYLHAEVKNADVGLLTSLVGPRIKTTLKYITVEWPLPTQDDEIQRRVQSVF